MSNEYNIPIFQLPSAAWFELEALPNAKCTKRGGRIFRFSTEDSSWSWCTQERFEEFYALKPARYAVPPSRIEVPVVSSEVKYLADGQSDPWVSIEQVATG